MVGIFEHLLWDRQFVEMVLLNLPKVPVIPVIAQCEKENKISHLEMTTSTKLCIYLFFFKKAFPY